MIGARTAGAARTSGTRRALAESGGNRAQAAERLGIRRQLLYQKLERYGLSGNGTEGVRNGDGLAEDRGN